MEEPTNDQVRTSARLDVHATKVIACVVDAESGEMMVHWLPGTMRAGRILRHGLPAPARAAYEAGPTGFGLARTLAAAGVGCVVAAPGKIERFSQDRARATKPS